MKNGTCILKIGKTTRLPPYLTTLMTNPTTINLPKKKKNELKQIKKCYNATVTLNICHKTLEKAKKTL